MSTRFLFVYGTLRPGAAAYSTLAEHVVGHQPGALPGYALVGEGHRYPWCIESAGDEVVGDLLEIPRLEELLPRLDAYEGVHDPQPEYRRVVADVIVADGTLPAWVYVGDVGVPPEAGRVLGGSWT